MDFLLSTEVLAGVLVGLSVLVVGLIALQIWSSLQIRRMSKTSYQDDVRQAQTNAASIVASARAEAQEVLNEANEVGMKAMAEAGQKAQKTNESYQAELHKIIERYNQELRKTIEQGQEAFAALTDATADGYNRRQEALNVQFDDVLEALGTVANTLNTKSTAAMSELESSIEGVAATLEQTLTKEDAAVRTRLEEHFSKILDKAEGDVDEYRKARLTLLDSHIERLVEDIAVQVLHKKLTLDEHGELAEQALADAKSHNVL